MKSDIEIIDKEIGNVLEIEENIPMWKMPSTMGSDFKAILEYIQKHGNVNTESPYARYLGIEWESQINKGFLTNLIEVFTKKWHFQSGIPVSKKIKATSPMKSTFLGNAQYVKTIHHGPYHKVGDTYKKMYTWAIGQNLELVDESIEFYLNDPREVKKEELETMVLIPITNNS